jgi:hypothetical protein
MFDYRKGLHSLGVVSPTVGVGVDSGVTGQLVRSAEALRTPGKSTGVRLLSRMRSDMSSLML